jgi:hypothetical protein
MPVAMQVVFFRLRAMTPAFAKLVRELDELVCALCVLTPQEIKIVEGTK